uniref:Uncharacterized protein n=1 Tax=Rhizophora mucronata TaxID=61149 RepID=A0A2P2N300_RHIMU
MKGYKGHQLKLLPLPDNFLIAFFACFFFILSFGVSSSPVLSTLICFFFFIPYNIVAWLEAHS